MMINEDDKNCTINYDNMYLEVGFVVGLIVGLFDGFGVGLLLPYVGTLVGDLVGGANDIINNDNK